MIQSTPVTDRAYWRALGRDRGRMLTSALAARARARQDRRGTDVDVHPPCAPVLRRSRTARAARSPPARRGRGSRRWLVAAALAFVAGAPSAARGEDPRARARRARSPRPGRAATTRRCTRCSTPEAQRRAPLERFAGAYQRRGEGGDARRASSAGPARRAARRRRRRAGACCARASSARSRGRLALPVVELDDGAGDRLAAPPRASPACGAASGSTRTTTLPPRAAIQARDGTPLAEGEARLSELGALAAGDRRPRRARAARARRRARAPRRAARTRRSGSPASSASSTPSSPAGPAATLRAGDRVLASRRAAARAAPCARRSTPRSSARRSRRSPGASAASP